MRSHVRTEAGFFYRYDLRTCNHRLLLCPHLIRLPVIERNRDTDQRNGTTTRSRSGRSELNEESPVELRTESLNEDADPARPELTVTGRVVSWLRREENGAIWMGDVFPPGEYTLVDHTDDERHPTQLYEKVVEGRHAGWLHTSENMSLTHSIPETAGVYLMVTPTSE